MSIDIDWTALTTGPSGLALADSIRDFIHDKFQQVTLPRFIRSVHVHSFDFGEECPVVELKDISDPLPEFYEDDDNDDDEEDDGEEEEDGGGDEESSFEAVKDDVTAPKHQTLPYHSTSSARPPPPPPPRRSSRITKQPLPNLDTRPANLKLNLRAPHLPFSPSASFDHLGTPSFLSRSTTTPGLPIPGGTSNFSYFHLPLASSAAGLSGTTTPLPWPGGSEQQQQQQQAAPPLLARPSTNISTNDLPPRHNNNRTSDQPNNDNNNNNNNNNNNHAHNPSDTDVQTTLHITYAGSLSLSLTAHLLLDYPMPSFVSIPLSLKITGLSFDGVALLAYIHRQQHHSGGSVRREKEGKKDVVHFCFLGREDAGLVLAGSGEGDGDGEGGEGGGGLLREIRVESEIGRAQGEGKGGQVLKNVGKVEKFVLEQVRRILEEEFVWPSFWTFLV